MENTVHRLASPEFAAQQKRWLLLLGFYVGIPAIFAVFFGASESGSAAFIAKQYYFLYFFVAGLPLWWAADITSRLVNAALRPWKLPLFVILVLGAVLAQNLQAIWTPLRHDLFRPYLVEGSAFYAVFPWRYSDPDYLLEAIIAWVTYSTLWVGANYLYIYWLDIPRFGHHKPAHTSMESAANGNGAAAASTVTPTAQAMLLDQLPASLGRTIIALKAEEHYTRIYTELGETLLLMRFRDAVELLSAADGLQTHRSYWVNAGHVTEFCKAGRSSHVVLSTGLQVPVSRSYRVLIEAALNGRLS